jgi:methylated-DNA-[protein]-cysteine S-methyltransferase
VAQPPATVQAAIEGIQALLMGEARDLCEVPLDMTRLTPFQREVYAMARAIPPGQTRTYGEMAQALGDAGLARAVGQALGHNPFAPVVPCHRVLAAGSRSGGFSARGGVATKLRMLQIEGAQIGGEPRLFDGDGR